MWFSVAFPLNSGQSIESHWVRKTNRRRGRRRRRPHSTRGTAFWCARFYRAASRICSIRPHFRTQTSWPSTHCQIDVTCGHLAGPSDHTWSPERRNFFMTKKPRKHFTKRENVKKMVEDNGKMIKITFITKTIMKKNFKFFYFNIKIVFNFWSIFFIKKWKLDEYLKSIPCWWFDLLQWSIKNSVDYSYFCTDSHNALVSIRLNRSQFSGSSNALADSKKFHATDTVMTAKSWLCSFARPHRAK